MWKKFALAGAVALAAAPAHAAPTINVVAYDWVPGLVLGDIHYLPGAPGDGYELVKGRVGIGQFRLVSQDSGGGYSTLFTFCIDIFNGIDIGRYSTVSLASQIPDAGRRDDLQRLLGRTLPLLSGASGAAAVQTSAAIQMAVWEIVTESSRSYSLTGGDFFITDTTLEDADKPLLGQTRAEAQGYLNALTAGSGGPRARLGALFAPDLQAQVFVGGVPEPATWLMMIAGFGAIGGALRRRSRPAAALAA